MNPLEALIGESREIVALRERVGRLLAGLGDRRPPPILIQGETGTGKGLLARAIHRAGPRAAGPFIDVNCAAIPESLLEAEMFGYERGAFTDARQSKRGLLEAAHHGTLFLDEVGLLPAAVQAKRALEACPDSVVARSLAVRQSSQWLGSTIDTLGSPALGANEPAPKLPTLEEIEAQWRAILQLRPYRFEAWMQLGVLAAQYDRVDDARACFERALALDPTHPGLLENLVTLESSEDRVDEALAYADLFDYPLSLGEIVRYLPDVAAAPDEVRACVAPSGGLRHHVASAGPYYSLRGREAIVETRRARAMTSRRLWQRTRLVAVLLARAPFVRMAAVTGALAVDNCDRAGDVDLLVVAAPGRVSTSRVGIVAVTSPPASNQPCTSTSTWAGWNDRTHTVPDALVATTTRFGVVAPGTTLRFDVGGCVPHGHTVT